MSGRSGVWPGLDFHGMNLAEIRRRVRGQPKGGGQPPPPAKQPERIGDILARMGFTGQRGQDDERD